MYIKTELTNPRSLLSWMLIEIVVFHSHHVTVSCFFPFKQTATVNGNSLVSYCIFNFSSPWCP